MFGSRVYYIAVDRFDTTDGFGDTELLREEREKEVTDGFTKIFLKNFYKRCLQKSDYMI